MTSTPETVHLIDITENVWTQFLGVELEPDVASPARAECASSIAINGAWNGVVVVSCSRSLARRAAAAMFHRDYEDMTEPQWRDALNEVANIIGGNVKALLPSPSRLDLPCFHADWHPPVGAQAVSFKGDGGLLHVLLIDQD